MLTFSPDIVSSVRILQNMLLLIINTGDPILYGYLKSSFFFSGERSPAFSHAFDAILNLEFQGHRRVFRAAFCASTLLLFFLGSF